MHSSRQTHLPPKGGVRFHRGPHATTVVLLPPTTEPSPPTKHSATASTPWKPSAAGPKNWAPNRSFGKLISTKGWIITRSHAVPVSTVNPVWHSAETFTSAGHRTLTHWPCSIKSWHKNTSFHARNHVSVSRVSCPKFLYPTIPTPKLSVKSFKMSESTFLILRASFRFGSVLLEGN